jgi:hypothetical protein
VGEQDLQQWSTLVVSAFIQMLSQEGQEEGAEGLLYTEEKSAQEAFMPARQALGER